MAKLNAKTTASVADPQVGALGKWLLDMLLSLLG